MYRGNTTSLTFQINGKQLIIIAGWDIGKPITKGGKNFYCLGFKSYPNLIKII